MRHEHVLVEGVELSEITVAVNALETAVEGTPEAFRWWRRRRSTVASVMRRLGGKRRWTSARSEGSVNRRMMDGIGGSSCDREYRGKLAGLLYLVHILQVTVELVDTVVHLAVELVHRRGVRRRLTEFAAVELELFGLVHVDEVFFEQVQVVKQLHLFAKHTAEHFHAMFPLQVFDVVDVLDISHVALSARDVCLLDGVGVLGRFVSDCVQW